MMTIKQFTDLRDGKCLKKLSYPVSYLYALFYMKGNWSQNTQEVTQGQSINVNDNKIITQIPYLLVHWKKQEARAIPIIWQLSSTKESIGYMN